MGDLVRHSAAEPHSGKQGEYLKNILENNERLFWNIELRNWSWRPEAVGWLVAGSPSPTTKSFPLLISDAFWLSLDPRKGSGSVLCRVSILFGFLISIVKEF